MKRAIEFLNKLNFRGEVTTIKFHQHETTNSSDSHSGDCSGGSDC